MNSESTFESIASLKQVERKLLRMTVKELKDHLISGEVASYAKLSRGDMWADVLTKEMSLPDGLEIVFLKNVMSLPNIYFNTVEFSLFKIRLHVSRSTNLYDVRPVCIG